MSKSSKKKLGGLNYVLDDITEKLITKSSNTSDDNYNNDDARYGLEKNI